MNEPIKLLYVEDELFLARIVKESLEGRGFTVFHTADGSNAIQLLESSQPHVCVLDVMLPNIDGFEIAKEIKAKYPQLPVLFVTAKTESNDAVEGLRIGASDYIRKPFSMEELIARIENIMRFTHSTSPSKAELNFGDYILYPHQQQLVYKNEQPLKLSHRECELLRLLWQNRSGIADRKLILLALWNDDSYFNSRNLDVYITRLRSYLKNDNRVEIITVKGQGYRFVLPNN